MVCGCGLLRDDCNKFVEFFQKPGLLFTIYILMLKGWPVRPLFKLFFSNFIEDFERDSVFHGCWYLMEHTAAQQSV